MNLTQFRLTGDELERFKAELQLGMVPIEVPTLSTSSREVLVSELESNYVRKVIAKLLAVGYGQQRAGKTGKRQRTLVGLAAPQIGENVRIIAVDTRVHRDRKYAGRLEIFINPQIIWRSRETEEDVEGCFSSGPVWGLLRRPVAIKIRALTPEGKATERIYEGFTARIFQHEYDHLDGIRFADRIKSDNKRHLVHSSELEQYKKHHKSWSVTCSRQLWQRLKSGGMAVLSD